MSSDINKIKSDELDPKSSPVTDAMFAIQIARYHLKVLGMWPNIFTSSRIEKIFSYFSIIICLYLIAFYMIPLSIFIVFIAEDISLRLKLTGAWSFIVMAILKYISLGLRQSNIAICINHMMNDWQNVESNDNRNIMLTHAQYGRYGSIACAAFMYGGAIFYGAILPQVSPAPINEKNETMRKLPFVGHFGVFDPQISPAYEIVVVTHFFCIYAIHFITSTTCAIAVIFVMHACGQLEILVNWLENIISDDERLHKRFMRIINQHVRTLRFITYTEDVLREICLVELIGCTLNICLLGYDILFEWGMSDAIALITYHILLFSFVLNIFVFCYIGEFLKDQCQKVGYTTYMMEWYSLPKSNMLGLTLLMATAQNPTTITAGKMFDLSISTFGSVIRTAVAYLNLLRTLIL